MPQERPPVLIEHWLSIAALGAESKRERGASSALPPLYFLHVWWARRPLTVSRAAILASVLPQWSAQWPDHLKERFPDEDTYHKWFIHLTGIRGDPVKGRQLIDWAKVKGVQLPFHPYGGAPRAFTVSPAEDDLEIMRDLLDMTWGTRDLTVLDPFAGGGSIPFESLRYGFTTIANDLNPVATTILKATLDYPARFGPSLANDIKKWGDIWAKRVEEKLAPYFPKQPGENIFAYLWARTVACPETGKPVPLSPNWWLSTGSKPVAVKLIAEPGMDTPRFEIVEGKAARDADPDTGTITRGTGRSPWTGQTIPGDYIKTEARAGRMGQILYAVAVKNSDTISGFRMPTKEDLSAHADAHNEYFSRILDWQKKGIFLDEPRKPGRADWAAGIYGLHTWASAYSYRQQLALYSFLDVLEDIRIEIGSTTEIEKANAIIVYLGMILNKCPNYNSLMSSWNARRNVMRSVFDRHDFAFKWSFAEFDAAANLLPWAVNQVVDSYQALAELSGVQHPLLKHARTNLTDKQLPYLKIRIGSAIDLQTTSNGSIHNITVDPPYYDNVQYAELSDFFYVWLKRSLGDLFPEFFTEELTNKEDEAIANESRFADLGRNRKKLAEQDYERKMAAAFREMYRVLHPDGVLTVMFTHKQVEAWDTLASALIGAGFVIKSSWPVHTESEHSLHQAKKNAAASTILLVCRKRKVEESEPIWWDDIQGRVRSVARASAADYAAQGVGGVDLYISTFGPTLSVISEQWPVLTSEVDPQSGHPKPLRPETALDLARSEVIRLRKEGLLAGRAITFDAVTDWYLMAWDAFQATEFPFDEARKLALALGLDLDLLLRAKKLVVKKGNYVAMQEPGQRRKRGMVDPDAAVFEHLIDALHTAMLIYAEDGAGACDVFLINRGLKRDTTFLALLQAAINAIPRTRIKGKFVRLEADLLDRLRLAFYANDLTVPVEEEPDLAPPEQPTLWDDNGEEGDGEEDDEMDRDE